MNTLVFLFFAFMSDCLVVLIYSGCCTAGCLAVRYLLYNQTCFTGFWHLTCPLKMCFVQQADGIRFKTENWGFCDEIGSDLWDWMYRKPSSDAAGPVATCCHFDLVSPMMWAWTCASLQSGSSVLQTSEDTWRSFGQPDPLVLTNETLVLKSKEISKAFEICEAFENRILDLSLYFDLFFLLDKLKGPIGACWTKYASRRLVPIIKGTHGSSCSSFCQEL